MKERRVFLHISAIHPEVTGSCNTVSVFFPDGKMTNFIVDFGLFQEKDYEELNNKLPFNPSQIDFCLVTHNHVDHIGRLPFMVKNGFAGKIYATKATKNLMRPALSDSVRVIKSRCQKNEKPIYEEVDVVKTLDTTVGCNYEETIEVEDNIKVTFFTNGHLIGAALILVQVSYYGCEDVNILFTGDYNNKNRFCDIYPLPDWVTELPITVVMESTYGYMDSTEIEEVFEKNTIEWINNGGGMVLLPTFSLGRSQETLDIVRNWQIDGILDKKIPIYCDGKLMIRYTDMCLRDDSLNIKPEMRDFLPTNLQYVSPDMRKDLLKAKGKKIIITTSGMGTYGPARTYIPEFLSKENVLIHFMGYTAEGTLGSKIINAPVGSAVEVGGLIVMRQARVESTKEFSAHAKRDELIDFLKSFKNLKLVLINHGRKEVKKSIGELILQDVRPKKVGILGDDDCFSIGADGLIKTIPVQFM